MIAAPVMPADQRPWATPSAWMRSSIFGQQRPGEAIGEETKTREQGKNHEDCPNGERRDPHPDCCPAGHAAQPALPTPADALPANPIKEARIRGGALLNPSKCGHRFRSLHLL